MATAAVANLQAQSQVGEFDGLSESSESKKAKANAAKNRKKREQQKRKKQAHAQSEKVGGDHDDVALDEAADGVPRANCGGQGGVADGDLQKCCTEDRCTSASTAATAAAAAATVVAAAAAADVTSASSGAEAEKKKKKNAVATAKPEKAPEPTREELLLRLRNARSAQRRKRLPMAAGGVPNRPPTKADKKRMMADINTMGLGGAMDQYNIRDPRIREMINSAAAGEPISGGNAGGDGGGSADGSVGAGGTNSSIDRLAAATDISAEEKDALHDLGLDDDSDIDGDDDDNSKAAAASEAETAGDGVGVGAAECASGATRRRFRGPKKK